MTEAFQRRWYTALMNQKVQRMSVAAGILVLAGVVSALIFATGPDGEAQPQTEKATPVSVVRATPAELHPMFATYGRVEARTQAELRANVRSTVAEVLVREGQWVQKGDLLIRLDDDELELQLREAQAEEVQQKASLESVERELTLLQGNSEHFEKLYQLSQGKLDRQRELAQRKMIPQSLYDSAIEQAARDTLEYQAHLSALRNLPNRISQQSAQLEIAQVKVEQAQLNLAKTEIRAPFSGPVLSVAANVGNITQIGAALATLADAESFEIRAAVPDQYASRIREHLREGNQIVANAMVLDQTDYQLQLNRVTSNVRAGQGSLDAFFDFSSDQLRDGDLPDLGRVLNLNTILPTEPGLIALPSQAIYENSRVYAVEDNRLQALDVEKVGEIRDDDGSYKILVRSQSLTNSHDLVITQLPKAINGLLVEPIGQEQPYLPTLLPNEVPNQLQLPAKLPNQGPSNQGPSAEGVPVQVIVGGGNQAISTATVFKGCTTTQGLTTIAQSLASLSCHSAA